MRHLKVHMFPIIITLMGFQFPAKKCCNLNILPVLMRRVLHMYTKNSSMQLKVIIHISIIIRNDNSTSLGYKFSINHASNHALEKGG